MGTLLLDVCSLVCWFTLRPMELRRDFGSLYPNESSSSDYFHKWRTRWWIDGRTCQLWRGPRREHIWNRCRHMSWWIWGTDIWTDSINIIVSFPFHIDSNSPSSESLALCKQLRIETYWFFEHLQVRTCRVVTITDSRTHAWQMPPISWSSSSKSNISTPRIF